MTANPIEHDLTEKQAYLKAQKSRNLMIALALFGFVVLVFLVSVVRMSEGIARDKAAREAGTPAASASRP